MNRGVEYKGDKATRPYLKSLGMIRLKNPGIKAIVCIRDPIDIINSKYWRTVNVPPITEFITTMEHFLRQGPDGIHIVRYENATEDIEGTVKGIEQYLGIKDLDITGHNYKPVRRYGWKEKNYPRPPDEILDIRQRLGYESISVG